MGRGRTYDGRRGEGRDVRRRPGPRTERGFINFGVVNTITKKERESKKRKRENRVRGQSNGRGIRWQVYMNDTYTTNVYKNVYT